jgi:photosystem II stability/assembly factor-like uncharacterized protein
MRLFKFVLIPAVLFLLPGIGQAWWFWQNPKPTGNTLRSVCFIDSTTGYAVGDLGTLLKTTDGGLNWSSTRNWDENASLQISPILQVRVYF